MKIVCGILHIYEEGYFWGFVVGRLGRLNMKRPYVELCTISPSRCGCPSGSIISHNPNKFAMHIMWKIMRCSNHVGLLPLFQGMAYGLSYTTTIYEGSNKRLGVSTMHQLYLFCYFLLGFNIRT